MAKCLKIKWKKDGNLCITVVTSQGLACFKLKIIWIAPF